MGAPRVVMGCFLAAAIAAGTIADRPTVSASRMLGGYHVLAADFHVHMFPQTWSTLSPWDTVIEAHYQGLDVIGMTPHDQIWAGKIGRWFSQEFGGPIVIVGEEITTAGYHLLGIGLTRVVAGNLPLRAAIDAVHEQGGVTIAAHPYKGYWPAYDQEALQALDASEVVRPEAQHEEGLASELREFFGRASLTAIGNSDYHGLGPLGYSRTYVFAWTRDEAGVLDALRSGRTVVYDRDRVYGDETLIRLVKDNGGLPHEIPELPAPGALKVFSRIAGVLALVGAVLFRK